MYPCIGCLNERKVNIIEIGEHICIVTFFFFFFLKLYNLDMTWQGIRLKSLLISYVVPDLGGESFTQDYVYEKLSNDIKASYISV